ncbi:transcription factor EMB1444-like [Silene latifolia]|uniref:transcription factor EMB1444-like n=1 Tax=Silene latifolia TaxID=37657 RepID=UPI003D7709D4
MATHLQQLLRSLCWKTEWNYAVFWTLEHHDRMVLTWEDGYYNNQDKLVPSESKSFNQTSDSSQDGEYAHSSLALAVANMSFHVHTLGEGIVGQVALTGKHQWIIADEHALDSYSTLEFCDGWKAQFASGIKTIVVAAVVPHGVIQFGSINKVNENLQFLAHIRDVFSSLQYSPYQVQIPVQCNLQHMLQMPDIPSIVSSPDVFQSYLLDKSDNKEHMSSNSADIPSLEKHIDYPRASLPGVHLNGPVGLLSAQINQSTDLLSGPNYSSSNTKIENGCGANDNRQICYPSQSCVTENTTLIDELRALDPTAKQNVEKNIDILPEFNCLETSGDLNSSFMFSAGTELHEALGPAFFKQCYPFPYDIQKPEDISTSHMPETVESSMLTSNSGKDHLLEAVVADFCRKDALKKSKSISTFDSMLTTERMPEPSISTSHTIGSSRYSMGCSSVLEESSQNCLNSSDSYRIRSSVEPGKPNKKRARPGENSRPRPRDRQLIQDRIKELRELVPNGSKCSIDSLLERTIKHMAFMQNVTKHSDKLSNCAKSKDCNEMGVLGSGYEQGSSWAVEVGGHMKICPILVENLNMNGQMLIEMLCDDCDYFLEITEAIRSLGLTVLKGITDGRGDKTWMRFVVEGQGNRNLHRMDVLWSLVQILQSKTSV